MDQAGRGDTITMGLPAMRRSVRTLADDTFLAMGRSFASLDPDIELFTYPECIDQREIGNAAIAWGGDFAHDDMEIDDGI